ncbi:MAG: N-6 DNA methylase [Candidatus Aminicenantes bacterium]|nr:N-6 DNA methylase [Candidatus Aminicenantes bacterium]
MADELIERYLSDIGEIRRTKANVPETSFYPALERLLSDIGKSLSPKVRCVINIANRGAGIPDGGLFSADQFARKTRSSDSDDNPFLVQNPSRGVIEAKPPSADIQVIVRSDQVGRYWERYGLVLATNFRAFVIVGRGPDGTPCVLESFTLAGTEDEFRRMCEHPRSVAAEHGERMLEYLKRVLLLNAPLSAPQDVAGILASYAHDARLRIEKVDLPALTGLRQALEEALGLSFEGDKGDHFFRSTLIQTLFYGVFSAWVLWARRREAGREKEKGFAGKIRAATAPYISADRFDWRFSNYLLRVPMLRALFVQVSDPDSLGALGLIEVLNWTSATLNRVDRAQFFKSFDEGHAVQYFYEPFLQAFDPKLRKELGVWYTPEEIVRYQVERVDAVLRSELDLPDGLADPKVVVLDPCCGTGAYLRAVLRRIAVTLHDKGGDALVANDLKKAVMERVFGFEILPAPFVIAHLQLGLELETLGAPLSDRSDPPERAGVYLTNALTGWEPPKEAQKKIVFPGFEEERDAAGKVKREKPILVILGNPPYNAFAGVSPEEEHGLVEPYKKGLISEWGIKKFNLDDLYIRFFRLAEKRIAEHGGRGVVSFISNFSYLGDPSFVIARQRFLEEFDAIWLDCMNGDSRETGKLTPEGKPDPSVFSTEWNREGIRVGTAIGLLLKRGRVHNNPTMVRFRHFWGTMKRADLLTSLDTTDFDAQYAISNPQKDNRWSFRPSDVTAAYMKWPKVTELCAQHPFNGPIERRGNSLIVFPDERKRLMLVSEYLAPTVSDDKIRELIPEFMKSSGEFEAEKTRLHLKGKRFDEIKIVSYPFKPFDIRNAYLDPDIAPLFSRPAPQLLHQRFPGNRFFISRDTADKNPEGPPFYFSPVVCDYDCISGHARHFPLRLKSSPIKSTSRLTLNNQSLPGMEMKEENIVANLSSSARAYLALLGLPDPDTDQSTAELIWYHALAIGYSPAYLTKNADGIRQDWPRISLPKAKDTLFTSAALGRQIAALLDTESPVSGVTAGKIPNELKNIGVFQRLDGKPAKPESGDLDLTAGWGHAGKGGVTMPGKGKLAARKGGAYDVFLNENTCWQNIPAKVWDFTIGGYQVIKKWLSYREKPLLGRGLTSDEVRYVTETARRLAAIVALQPALDENYRQVIKATYAWPK